MKVKSLSDLLDTVLGLDRKLLCKWEVSYSQRNVLAEMIKPSSIITNNIVTSFR